MNKRTRLAVFDLDGTLFDTKNVNYHAYLTALEAEGFDIQIDYQYYCDYCNGNHYRTFLPQIIPNITEEELKKIHELKKERYVCFLDKARKNESLFALMKTIRNEYVIALATTASRKNTTDILRRFSVEDCFDLIITQEDVAHTKPSPECFLKAMDKTGIPAERTLIFEDSETGLQAAERSGAEYIRVYGYN